MRPFLILNPRSGDERPSADELADAARELGVDVHVLEQGDDLTRLALDADADVIGMAGGDGSLAPVAQACIDRDLPFVCIPFGTRNHFARDVGLDRDDPVAALAAFADDAVERRVDVGRADDRLFLNNVSLGLYAGLVHDRERRRRGDEAFARLKALARLAVNRHPAKIMIDSAPIDAHIVLVSNNAYAMDVFSVGERERLDEGRLYLYVAAGVVPRQWETRAVERIAVDTRGRKLHAAVDGEPELLETPVTFVAEPGALRVRLPAERDDER